MPTITFYRQARRDGGARTGIDIDDNPAFMRFDEARTDDFDPALLWYVDVRCKGPRLPSRAEEARRWLLKHEGPIAQTLRSLADELPAGIDPSEWPITRHSRLAGGVEITVACSVLRRADGQRIARVLRELAEHWRAEISNLPAPEAEPSHGKTRA